MSAHAEGLRLLWADPMKSYPICDVPWYGRSVILSSGDVHFCCFSGAIVGNVNQQPFEEIWNGPKMQEIREALTEGTLPAECRSPSCPVFVDETTGTLVPIIQRLPQDVVKQNSNRVAEVRDRLLDSELIIEPSVVRPGQTVRLKTIVRADEYGVTLDRYLAIRNPDGSLHFVPRGDSHPLPYAAQSLVKGTEEFVLELPVIDETTPGEYEVCSAFFDAGSSSGFVENCYWSACAKFTVVKD